MEDIADNAVKILVIAFILALAISLGGELYRKAYDPNYVPLYTYGDLGNQPTPAYPWHTPATDDQQAAPVVDQPAPVQHAAPKNPTMFILPPGTVQPPHTSCIGQPDGSSQCWDNR